MADKFLTLLDMTKLSGSDQAVGLVDEVNIVAPELEQLYGRPINGITYKASKRTAYAGSGGSAFRSINEGTDLVASSFSQTLSQCFFLDAQLQVDEALVMEKMAEGGLAEDILAEESSSAMQQKVIQVGDQFYRGNTADAKGFSGLQAFYDTANCEVSATGSSGSATSAWLIWNDIQGVHWIWGNNAGLQAGEWKQQQVKDSNSKAMTAWVNNVKGFLGLSCVHSRSVVRIKLITAAAPLTDALVAEAISKLPIFMRRSAGLKLMMNSTAQLLLQKSRSTVNLGTRDNTNGDKLNRLSGGLLQFAPLPIESNGIPIILTDSIPNNE